MWMCAGLCHLQLLPLSRLCEEEVVAGACQTEQVRSWAVLVPAGFFSPVPISRHDGSVCGFQLPELKSSGVAPPQSAVDTAFS